MRPRRLRARRRVLRAARARRRLARLLSRFHAHPRARRRVAVALVALVFLLLPVPVGAAGGASPAGGCLGAGCPARTAVAERWAVRLSGDWAAGAVNGPAGTGTAGDGSTVPAAGPGYVAVGGGSAVLGAGLSLTSYRLDNHVQRWQVTLGAPPGTQIISVRAWPGVITAGLLAPGGQARTEVVIDAQSGAELRRYPATVFGGAVAASRSTTVVLGQGAVTSYNNATGRVRWRRPAADGQSWRVDGQQLLVTASAGGYAGTAPISALRVIDLTAGTVRTLASPRGRPFSGTLALAAGGAVLFASPSGVTAYSEATGGALWSRRAAVTEGTDPAAGLVYLTTADGSLAGVEPLTGTARTRVAGAVSTAGGSALYVVRGGIVLGLSSGANGAAWGYDVAAGRVAGASTALPWPHFFSDVSGLGGSAAVSGNVVVVTACPHLASVPGLCADPELVAFSL